MVGGGIAAVGLVMLALGPRAHASPALTVRTVTSVPTMSGPTPTVSTPSIPAPTISIRTPTTASSSPPTSGAGAASPAFGADATAGASSQGGSAGYSDSSRGAALRAATGRAVGSGTGSPGRLVSEPQLRRLVSRLRSCLGSLPPVQTRALVLRTGLGLKHAYTRRQVAQILGVTIEQEGSIESRTTAALTTQPAEGQCGKPAASVRSVALQALSPLVVPTRPTPVATESSATETPGEQPTGVRPPLGNQSRSQRGQQPQASSAIIALPARGGFAWPLRVLLVAAGLLALWFLLRRLRTRTEGGAVTAPPPASEEDRVLTQTPRPGAGAIAWMGHLRRGADALAGVIGAVGLRQAASTRNTSQHSAPLEEPTERAALPSRTTWLYHELKGLEGLDTSRAGLAARPAPEAYGVSPAPAVPAAPDAPPTLSDTSDSLAEAAACATPGTGAIEAFELGAELAQKGDMTGAEDAYRRADEQGHPSAASNLGVLLEQQGDVAGAEAAYRRADERGDATGAFNLAAMLADRGDLVGAEAALRRADHHGDAVAAFNLGVLMERRNDLSGAEAAFRRADERGDAAAPAKLGILLEARGDLRGADAAFRRGDDRGDAAGAFKVGALLEKGDDIPGAEAAYARATERGQGYVAELAHAALTLLRSAR